MVLENVLISFFRCSCLVFIAPRTENTAFSSLYFLSSFIIDELNIGVCVYFRACYPVPLIYVAVSMPAPYCLALQYSLKSGSPILPALSFFKVTLAISGSFACPYKFEIFHSSYVENAIGNLIWGNLLECIQS